MVSENDSDTEQTESGKQAELSDAQRARAERSRQKARALREARLVRRAQQAPVLTVAPDSGGGFLIETEEEPARMSAPSAPLVHHSVQPSCLQCGERFPQSFLLDHFDCHVCDECRDDSGEHALLPRTQAKAEYLLQDCDLDSRPPPLRALSRPNPHRARAAPMRLYLRTQLEQRAIDVWGSLEGLERERETRAERRDCAAHKAAGRRLRALRMDVRSSLYVNARAPHQHSYGPETHDAEEDVYRRECACGHVETYEKM